MSNVTDPTATDTDDDVVTVDEHRGYVEDPEFVPNPTDQWGQVDTSGTGGKADSRIEEVTPIFDVARKQDLAIAARALDPDDPDVHESLVTLPPGQNLIPIDHEEIRESVRSKAATATTEDVALPHRGAAQREAAQSGEEGAETAAAQQSEQGVGGGATDGGGAGETTPGGLGTPGGTSTVTDEDLAPYERGGGWYLIDGERVQGADDARALLARKRAQG